jgi:hypothetical protein
MKKGSIILAIFLVVFSGTTMAQKMTVRDNDLNVLMEVEDKGIVGAMAVSSVSTDSMTFSSLGTAPGSTDHKLYNVGGTLHWNGAVLDTGSAPWTANGWGIHYSGNVGIGTTQQVSKLSVGGDGDINAVIYGSTASGSGHGVHGVASNGGDVTNYGGYFIASGHTGRGVFGYADGTDVINYGVYGSSNSTTGYDFYAGGSGVNYGATSSIRWKRNIFEINDPLKKLAHLRGIYFNWDEEHGGHRDVGMIAEEVGEVLPEIVVYEGNGIDANGMDYSKITPLLVEVAKAQQKLIINLIRRLELLEGR